MVVSGEKEGPLQPSYKYIGGILFSDNAVAFDHILVRLMGFNPENFPTLRNAMRDKRLSLEATSYVDSNVEKFRGEPDDFGESFMFVPTEGWKEVLG